MAANPKYYKPLGLDSEYDVSFVGMNYAKRAAYMYHLLASGINVNCFGGGWVKPKGFQGIKKETRNYLRILQLITGRSPQKRFEIASIIKDYELSKNLRANYSEHLFLPVNDDEMVQIFNKSKINLGFLEVYTRGLDGSFLVQQHLHLREFEVPMSGGLYFTNYSDELTEFFEPGREVVVFRNDHELLDKVRFYLNNSGEAEKIREAGYKRAINDHTYQARLKSVFSNLKLSGS
jgi:spore maturation protein CgeB